MTFIIISHYPPVKPFCQPQGGVLEKQMVIREVLAKDEKDESSKVGDLQVVAWWVS